MLYLVLFLIAGITVAYPTVNGYTWNLWLSGYESVPEMVISKKYDFVNAFFTGVQLDASLPKNEAQRRLDQWAMQQNNSVQQNYRGLENLLNRTHQNFVLIVRNGFNSQLSPQAQNVVREIQRIENNKYLALRDVQQQINQILSGITYNIQSELRQFDQKATEIYVRQYGSPTIGPQNQPLLNLRNNGGGNEWNSNGNGVSGPNSNQNQGGGGGWDKVGAPNQVTWAPPVTDGWNSITNTGDWGQLPKVDATKTNDWSNSGSSWDDVGNK